MSDKKSVIKKNSSDSSSDISTSTTTSTTSSFIDKDDLEDDYNKLDCNDKNMFSGDCNKFLLKRELVEREELEEQDSDDERDYLYPNLNDPNFNIKIAQKKEFNDTQYDGPDFTKSVEEQADFLANAPYELQPHQAFVKNFMSSNTPYSSLLLFHGLGSGKTCSAIGVTEEHRDYMRQIGTTKRIIIVATENVQENFRSQLFDERKLEEINGVWTMRGCIGNKLLKEINPRNMPMKKEKVISLIKNLINTYYLFMGYIQFANYIIKTMSQEYEERIKETEQIRQKHMDDKKQGKKGKDVDNKGKREKTKIEKIKEVDIEINDRVISRLRKEFSNRMIVIDEVHNIRKTDNSENKKVAIQLEHLVKAALNIRFLFLSATPMYNNYKEIIWLLNIMNMNDDRGKIEVKDVFKSNGEYKKGGEELLIRKATGYVSFVRGENPYTFPYRVYPITFAPKNTFPHVKYPSHQMNLKRIRHDDKNRILSLYLNNLNVCEKQCGACQYCCYKYIIYLLREQINFEDMESFGYTTLLIPVESLIISYPHNSLKQIIENIPEAYYSEELTPSFSDIFDEEDDEEPKEQVEGHTPREKENEKKIGGAKAKAKSKKSTTSFSSVSSDDDAPPKILIEPGTLTGKKGLDRMMIFKDNSEEKGHFEYKKQTLDAYGKIFSQQEIGKYSVKIKTILDKIYDGERVSDGVILIYSNYIDSGLVPMALALEEMGFTRYGEQGKVKPLFGERPTPVVDVRTMKPPTNKDDFKPARYTMITGDHRLSPNNAFEVKGLTNDDNKDGHNIKIILISRSGSEGIDFKFIRQVHLLDPWYNMNRPEQVIGRAVRNLSHFLLQFKNRNVEIYLHGTIIGDNEEEAADLYVYRVAEFKAIQIGKVTRTLKETSVDCILNYEQTKFTQEMMAKHLKDPITQVLSTGEVIHNFKIGDAPFSPACDYMASCNYSCRPNKDIDEDDLNEDTYDQKFIITNSDKILQRIRMLFKEAFFYKKDVLLKSIRTPKEYPYVQIYSALTELIEDENEFLVDKYGRNGRLVNIGEYYLFQPLELKDKNVSIYERSVPLDYKHNMINFDLKKDIVKQIPKPKSMTMSMSVSLAKEQSAQQKVQSVQIDRFPKGKKVFDSIKADYDMTQEYFNQPRVDKGEKNWYKYAAMAMKKLSKDFPAISKYLITFLVAHMIEILLYEDKHELMNYIYSLEQPLVNGSLEKHIKEYFERNTFATSKHTIYLAYDLNIMKTLILNENNEWVEATKVEQINIAKSGEVKLEGISQGYNDIVGFIGYEKGNKRLLFKTKNMTSKRDTGVICSSLSKNINLDTLNKIVGSEKYTHENTKLIKKNNVIVQDMVTSEELCVLTEFILRLYNETREKGKKWFLTPEMAIGHGLYKISADK